MDCFWGNQDGTLRSSWNIEQICENLKGHC